MIKRSFALAAALGLLLMAASCKRAAQPHEHGAEATHRGVGVIESVDRDVKTVQINHEEIKDYMPAMSMPYKVREASLLDNLNSGDRVEFTLQVTPSGQVISEIKKRAVDNR